MQKATLESEVKASKSKMVELEKIQKSHDVEIEEQHLITERLQKKVADDVSSDTAADL